MNEKELKQLQKGLDYSFVDKNKYVKKEYCMKLGKSCRSSGQGLDNEKKESFRDFLRDYTDILSKNLHFSKIFFNELHIQQLETHNQK